MSGRGGVLFKNEGGDFINSYENTKENVFQWKY